MSEESREEAGERQQEDRIYDALNRLESPNFFLSMQVRERRAQAPSGRRMRDFLASRLRDLDPDGPLPGDGNTSVEAGGFPSSRSRRAPSDEASQASGLSGSSRRERNGDFDFALGCQFQQPEGVAAELENGCPS